MRAAEAGIDELQEHVDTLIVIPNQNLFLVAQAETTFKEAFQLADEVLQQGVRSITDLMVMPGLINLDFADVRSVMSEMGKAMMGTGEGEGENRALDAAEQAIANPLLDGVSMQGAKGVIISIIGGEDMKLLEVDEAANHIRELVDEDANIIWGSAFNPDLDGKIRVSVVATGIEQGAVGSASDSAPVALSSARAPKKPALPLPGEEDVAAEAEELPAMDLGSFSEAVTEEAPEPEVAEEEPYEAEPFDLSGMQAGDDLGEDDDDDVDGIVDPLAGLRGADDDFGGGLEEPAEDSSFGSAAEPGFGDTEAETSEEDTFDLTSEVSASEGGDDLLGEADRLAEEDNPVEQSAPSRRDGILGSGTGEEPAGGASGAPAAPSNAAPAAAAGGSTLFERMANLSRASSTDDKDEDDEDEDASGDDAPALSIPRFLGRQNNQ